MGGWVGHGKVEEIEAVGMSYCELGLDGWVGVDEWAGRWMDEVNE